MSKRKVSDLLYLSADVQNMLRLAFAFTLALVLAWSIFVNQANAAGATQISGLGVFDDSGSCSDAEGAGSDFATILTGDLTGCQYVFVESSVCSPSGTYREVGREIYVVEGPNGEVGTFETTYYFSSKFEECVDGQFPGGAEIFGRCQHPITKGSGTGDFAGVSGRLDFKDDIEAGNFPYRGHLKY